MQSLYLVVHGKAISSPIWSRHLAEILSNTRKDDKESESMVLCLQQDVSVDTYNSLMLCKALKLHRTAPIGISLMRPPKHALWKTKKFKSHFPIWLHCRKPMVKCKAYEYINSRNCHHTLSGNLLCSYHRLSWSSRIRRWVLPFRKVEPDGNASHCRIKIFHALSFP